VKTWPDLERPYTRIAYFVNQKYVLFVLQQVEDLHLKKSHFTDLESPFYWRPWYSTAFV